MGCRPSTAVADSTSSPKPPQNFTQSGESVPVRPAGPVKQASIGKKGASPVRVFPAPLPPAGPIDVKDKVLVKGRHVGVSALRLLISRESYVLENSGARSPSAGFLFSY